MTAKRKQKTPLHRHVRRHLKHWFVPHAHNDHRPHLIRLHGLAVVALLIIGVQITANLVRPAGAGGLAHGRVLAYATDTITPVDLFNQTNQERVAGGLPALHLDARLNQSAGLKAGNMFAENYWAHVSPSGIQPWHWFEQAGYAYTYAGENLAKDFDTTSGAIQGWMNSPGHRANILNPNYTDVGFAVQNGTLVGGQTTLIVAHYGATAGSAVAAATPAPQATPKPAPLAAAATPAPTATPIPTATPTPAPTTTLRPVVATGQITPSAPPPRQYSLFQPLSIVRTLNFGTLVTLLLLLVLLIVYVVTHLTVWRKGLRRWSSLHYRLFAAAQVSSLAVAIISLAVSGFGTVG
ncbi:MAG TPA: CAP domain-containing protein [Candidatus Saccharimonadia bacterium]|nr:CAP domain-containing protein [Candidatus Saccharimonadia bacterium]